MERLERLGVWCPEVSFFHAFHDFQGVQNRFWNQVPRACFWCPGAPFFHAFHAFHVVRGSLLDSAPRARFWCPGAPFFHAFQVGFLGPPNTPLETLESVEMVEATCPAKRPAFEGRWFFLWACRGCNNPKRYDVQPTLEPDHGSQRKARRFCAGLQSRAMNLQASRGSPHAAPLRRQAFAVAAASRAPCSPSTSQSLQRPRALTVAAAPDALSSLSPAAPSKPQSAAAQAPHSGCSPRCPQQPLALQPPKPSQSLQPPSPHSPVVAAPQALTVAAASRASLLLFSPDPRGWVRAGG